MSFSLATFANAVGPDLIQAFLRHVGVEIDVGQIPTKGRGGFGRGLQSQVAALPPKEREAIEAPLTQCERMNNFVGDHALFAVAEDRPDLTAQLDALNHTRARMLALYLEDAALFREAEFRQHAAHYRGTRFWSRFRIRAGEIPVPSIQSLERPALAQVFQRAHPERRAVQTEAAYGGGSEGELVLAIFIALPTNESPEFEGAELKRRTVTGATTTTLVFEPRTQILEIAGISWRSEGRDQLAQLFVEHGLGLKVEASTIGPDPLKLLPLVTAAELTLAPDDDIFDRVTVAEVRWPSRSGLAKSYSVLASGGQSVWTAIEADLGPAAATRLQSLPPIFVRLRATERARGPDAVRVSYEVALHANGKNNLRETTPGQKRLIEVYLERWGARIPSADADADEDMLDTFGVEDLFQMFDHGGSASTRYLQRGLGAEAFDQLSAKGALVRAYDATLWSPPGGGDHIALTRDPETGAYFFIDDFGQRVVVTHFDPNRTKIASGPFARAVARVALADEKIEIVERIPDLLWEATDGKAPVDPPWFVARNVGSLVRWSQIQAFLETRLSVDRGGTLAVAETRNGEPPPLGRFKLAPLNRILDLGPRGFELKPEGAHRQRQQAKKKPGPQDSIEDVERHLHELEREGVRPQTKTECANQIRERMIHERGSEDGVRSIGTIMRKLKTLNWEPSTKAS